MTTQVGVSPTLPSQHVQSLVAIEDGYWWFLGRIRWAERMISRGLKLSDRTSFETYADVGCGTGGFANAIQCSFKIDRSYLVDGDPAVLNLASRYPQFRTQQTNLAAPFRLPVPADLITCMDVLEHLKDDFGFCKRLYENLNPGGLLVASVPAYPWLYSEWDKQLGHYRRYTQSRLRHVFQRAGFEVLDLRAMWSFLFPVAWVRLLRSKRYQEKMEFEAVSSLTNSLLIKMSDFEWMAANVLKVPLGTSLMVLARKAEDHESL